MSGEMWTSLANGFSNLMNMLFLMEETHTLGEGYIDGDDGIFGLDKNVISAEDFEKLGFKIKMSYGQDLSHTSFCGNIFDPEECIQLVPPEQIARLGWTCSAKYLHSRRKIQLELLKGKAMSLYCLGKNTPIAGCLARRVIELLSDVKYRSEFENVWWENQVLKLWSGLEDITITEKSRLLYEKRFHILVNDQLKLEEHIRSINNIDDLDVPYYFMNFNGSQLF